MISKKAYDIVTLGELLIDFTEHGVSGFGQKLFEQNPGGAVANAITAASRCGMKTALIGKIGNDMHGQYLKYTLENAGIDTRGLVVADDVFTTLAFVALNASGERSFSFARKPGADTCLTWDEVDKSLLDNTKILHIGSLSLTDEPSRSATIKALEYAKNAGAIISYDPNYRASLWNSEADAIENMRSVLPYVDIMKLSDEETAMLTGLPSVEDAAKALMENGIQCVAVTLGKAGALVGVNGEVCVSEGYDIPAIDTTGAGDAFWGGFLYKVLASGKQPQQLTLSELQSFGRFGNATATLCVQRRGGMPAMPTLAETQEFMGKYH